MGQSSSLNFLGRSFRHNDIKDTSLLNLAPHSEEFDSHDMLMVTQTKEKADEGYAVLEFPQCAFNSAMEGIQRVSWPAFPQNLPQESSESLNFNLGKPKVQSKETTPYLPRLSLNSRRLEDSNPHEENPCPLIEGEALLRCIMFEELKAHSVRSDGCHRTESLGSGDSDDNLEVINSALKVVREDGSCTDTNNARAPDQMLGEMWGFDSRCKQSSLVLSGFVRGTLTQGNGCYQHHCRNKTLEIVVEEPKQQKTTPPSRPSKGLALPSANNESISLLLRNLCPPHGTMSVIGRRREMEDVVAGVPSFFSLPKPTVLLQNSLTRFAAPAPTPLHFFGVYDGHGGSQASIYCKNRFHKDLAEKLRDASSFSRDLSYWNQVMSARFMKMDMAVGGMCPNGGCSSNADVQMISDCCRNPVAPENVGSTAFVSPTQFVIANCGDSRAVLSRGGKVIPLSNDHKSEREDEMGCIEAAGGHAIYWNGYPVGGFLAMSRAPGVRFLKRYVISEPKVTCTEQTNEDQCLILASDGLWDVLSNDIVCEVARKCLAGFRPHCSKGITEDTPVGAAAALLTKLAGLNILNP
ncbi:hypothetical protein SUGI_0295460, partial [Cryptomeria japonica]